jgi:hypothetical protein
VAPLGPALPGQEPRQAPLLEGALGLIERRS